MISSTLKPTLKGLVGAHDQICRRLRDTTKTKLISQLRQGRKIPIAVVGGGSAKANLGRNRTYIITAKRMLSSNVLNCETNW